MGHSDKEILALVRDRIAHGTPLRRALSAVIREEGPTLDYGRRGYLYRVIPKRVERAERRKEKRDALRRDLLPIETPLPDDSTPLSYEINDDGQFVIVSVDRYVFTVALTYGKASMIDFSSLIEHERVSDVSSEIRFQARQLAQDYFDRLPRARKRILRRPF